MCRPEINLQLSLKLLSESMLANETLFCWVQLVLESQQQLRG
jgi:hypothetical protein